MIHQRIRPTWGLGVALLATALAWTVEAQASSLTLNFSSPIPGTIAGQNGTGTGLTDRLPGTGGALPSNDPNLALNTSQGVLQITSSSSDLNGQLNMASGEYLGTRLADLGFTGSQNFSVSATFLNVQYSQDFDQFGLYVGNASDQNFRAGFVFASIAGGRSMFSTPNSGVDFNTVFGSNAPAVGDDIVLTLSRTGGTYAVDYQNLTNPALSGLLSLVQPTFLNGQTDLYVGIFAANARNNDPKVGTIDAYSVNVVPEPSSMILFGNGAIGLWAIWRVAQRRGGPPKTRRRDGAASNRAVLGIRGLSQRITGLS